nr:hypothetical protein [Tanacetum cinerariifolium]
ARIAQSSALPLVADEPASPVRDVSQGEACPTDSSFIIDQNRATIAKSSTLPHDSAPRVTSPVNDEGKILKLKERVKVLEDREGIAATRSGDDAQIKGRRWKVKDFKGMTFKEVEAKFNSVYKQLEDFIPMGSKEEVERYKRKAIRFDQESLKKLKSSEKVIEEAKSTDEIPEEKIKEMMQLIPIE